MITGYFVIRMLLSVESKETPPSNKSVYEYQIQFNTDKKEE